MNDILTGPVSSLAAPPTCGENVARARAVRVLGGSFSSVLGIVPKTNWEIVGSGYNIDIGKLRRNMVSGENSGYHGTVMSQSLDFPVSQSSSKKPDKHGQITFQKFQEAMLVKSLIEADPLTFDHRVKN